MAETTKPRKHRGRSAVSGILIAIALILTPVSLVANWAAYEVDNTSHFVDALGPLASNPDVQNVVINEITNRVDEAVDIKKTTSSLIDGLGEALNLPEPAQKALGLVSDPLAAGVKGLVHDAVSKVVKSDGFQKAWVKVLTVTQEQATKLLKGEEGGALSLTNDGTISLNLKPVIAEVKQSLVANGVQFANAIPEVDVKVDLGKVPELAVARVVYQIGVGVGTWLPWIVLGMMLLGLALAVRRMRVLLTVSVLVLVESVLMLVSFNLVRLLVTNGVGDTYAAAVGVAFDALAAYVFTVLTALVALSIIVGVTAWIMSGDERAPVRRGITSALEWSRNGLNRAGMTMGSFGTGLYRARIAIRSVILVAAALIVIFAQPMNVATVIWTAVVALILLLVLELLLRVPTKQQSATRSTATTKKAVATKAPAKSSAARGKSRS